MLLADVCRELGGRGFYPVRKVGGSQQRFVVSEDGEG